MEETEKKVCIRVLFAKAQELGIETVGMTVEEVRKAVEEAEKNNL